MSGDANYESFLPFQRAIADEVERRGIDGVSKATSVPEVVEQARYYCESDETPDLNREIA